MTEEAETASPGESRAPRSDGENLWNEIRSTLPLLALTGALFSLSIAFFVLFPRAGPRTFPLWGLLLTLGFVAAIGSAVSLFFATEEPGQTEAGDRSADTGGKRRVGSREFGRPAPEITPLAAHPIAARTPALVGSNAGTEPDPWNEDLLPPAAIRGPRPVLTTLDDPGDISRALEEIAEIQRQLATRPTTAAADTPARA